MKKILVFLMMLSFVVPMVIADDFTQDFQGQPVSIAVNDLDFEYILGSGPTNSQGTIFDVTPNEAIVGLGLFVDAVLADITAGVATVEYSEDDSTWIALSDEVSFKTNRALNQDNPETPTLWIRLNNISGSEAISGTITYTIMPDFVTT